MPSPCCVPACRSNYQKTPNVSVFRFPKDEEMQDKWLAAIKRANFAPTKHSRVCIKHFQEKDVLTVMTAYNSRTGEILQGPLGQIRLVPWAIPSIFHKESSTSRKNPAVKTPKKQAIEENISEDEENTELKKEKNQLVLKFNNFRDKQFTKSSGTTSKEEDRKTDHIPLEPAIEIKEEPVDYEPTPSTSTEAANEEFILPHEENTWTPPVQPPPSPAVEPQFTLSVAGLAPHNNPETSDSEQQVGKKRKIKSSTFVPSTNGSEVRPESPVYNFGDSSNPGSSKEPRKDQFDVFGEYIAAKLRSLDKRSRAYAQKAIGDIIFEAEMGKYLNEDSDSKVVLNSSAS